MTHPDDALPPRGYTLPVWLAAAARAAVGVLRGEGAVLLQPLELITPPRLVTIPVQAAASLGQGWVLSSARCDPGDGLDLTRGLQVWVLARWLPGPPGPDWLELEAGEGVGVQTGSGQICLSAYARRLLEENVRPLVPRDRRIQLRVVLPAGRQLAERTSNAAFGVVEGLALIGTQAEVQASADPSQLQRSLDLLDQRVAAPGFKGDLVLVIGENGLDLAPRVGLPRELLLKAGNWIGPLLVASAQRGVRRLLLFGYQGKLIKLAGGIFHTHHHLADGRAEILTALAALEGLGGESLKAVHGAATVESALADLEARDPRLAERLRRRITATIERRCQDYLIRHGAGPLDGSPMEVGAVLFDRARRIVACGPAGTAMLGALGRPT